MDPEQTESLTGDEWVTPMVMRGREMRGWLRVDTSVTTAADQLEAWVARGAAYARSLPAKRGQRPS